MRKSLILCAMILACWFGVAQASGPLRVTVGVLPMQYFAERIGGRHVRVTVLVPPGAEPHSYEPKPSQMRALATSAVYLSTGLGFEQAWEPRIRAANHRLVFCHVDAGLHKLTMPSEDSHGGRHAVETDPHLWVAPPEVRQMAGRIAESFSQADPANARVYAANLAAFRKEIDGLDAGFRKMFAKVPAGHRSFMVFHPAWGYFAHAYGLTQVPIQFEGKEPSPQRLAALVSLAKSKHVRVIFVQPEISSRSAATIARAVGARLVYADPLARDWAANLRNVAKGFRAALE